jgi:shikimate dehydrogenase
VFRDGGQLCGDNTDADGLCAALHEAGATLQGARAVVLGAGGAARASVVGLARAGASRVTIAARRATEAQDLAKALEPHVGRTRLDTVALERDALGRAFVGAGVLVQATSATLDDNPAAGELAALLPLDALPADALVTDLVYKPLETTVLAAARGRGLRTLDGLGMLLHQGALSLERWTGRKAPVAEMRAALLSP